MRVFLLTVFTINFFALFGQKTSLEQISFNYYIEEICEFEQNKSATLWAEVEEFDRYSFWFPKCLDLNNNSESIAEGDLTTIIKNNDKRLKIKEPNKGKYPQVYVTNSFSFDEVIYVVNVVEIHKHHGVIHHIQLNLNGEILNHCRGGWIE